MDNIDVADSGDVHEIYAETLPETLKEFLVLMVDGRPPKTHRRLVFDAKACLLSVSYSICASLFLVISIAMIVGIFFHYSMVPLMMGVLFLMFTVIIGLLLFKNMSPEAVIVNSHMGYGKLLDNREDFLKAFPVFDKLLAIYSLEPERYEHLNLIYIEECFKYFDAIEKLKRENFEFKIFQKNLDRLNDELEVNNLRDRYGL